MKYAMLAATAALFAASAAPAAELVTNGNFSAGNTGFTTTYGQPGSAAQGSIFVTANPASVCNCFVSIGDHTTGTGNMLLIDGGESNPGAFWSQSFAVVANSVYSVSFWASNAGTTGQRPIVRASVNGLDVINTGLIPYSTGNTATTWQGYAGTFNSGAATTVTFSLFSDVPALFYNDFVVDDISFTGPAVAQGVPEPATWAMMMLGFGALGGVMRRRQKVTARVRYA